MPNGMRSRLPIRRTTFFGAGALQLVADVLGDSSQATVVFSPGGGQTRHAWRGAAEALATQGYCVISLDLRGHGESAWATDGDYSIDAFVGDIQAVMDTLPAPPVLVGASIGGIASLMAAADPTTPPVRALVLVDVVPDMSENGLDRIRAFMSAGSDGFADLNAVEAAVASFLPHRRTGSKRGLMHNLRSGRDGRLYWHWDPAFHSASTARAAGGMLTRMAVAARAVHMPALLVSGAHSDVVTQGGAEQLLRLMPQAQWHQVANAAHRVASEENDSFNAAVIEFVRHLPSPPQAT